MTAVASLSMTEEEVEEPSWAAPVTRLRLESGKEKKQKLPRSQDSPLIVTT